jgi:hypothetical protein
LQLVMRSGVATARIDLEESRQRFRRERQRLPDHLRELEPAPTPYPVSFSEGLENDLDKIQRRLARDRALLPLSSNPR